MPFRIKSIFTQVVTVERANMWLVVITFRIKSIFTKVTIKSPKGDKSSNAFQN